MTDGRGARDVDDRTGLVHLRRGGVSLLLDCRGPDLPVVLHWGADLGEADEEQLAGLVAALGRPARRGAPQGRPVGLVPEHAHAWFGTPGVAGHRDGRDWSPHFRQVDRQVIDGHPNASATVSVVGEDVAACLRLDLEVELDRAGLVRLRARLRNDDTKRPYQVEGLLLALPVPAQAVELLDLTGRHCRERSPQRLPFTLGTRLRESRRGRPGLDATLLMVAGTEGFGFQRGEVWGVHVGWSGNQRTLAERLPEGEAVLGGGELLLPGELSLGPGESYQTPWVYGSYGHGLDAMSARFHEHLRRRADPGRTARPVVVNTWEAVYFSHDLDRLTALADLAAEVGAERFVLDDGWMRGRRHDRAGLGDWYVDEQVWPGGLHALVDHVRSLGLEFGLWVEPEMVNADSDLARAHPDWILATGGRLPREGRWQQVLDLARPAVWSYLLDRLDRLVREYSIGYLKWDHNRDLIDAGHGPTGRAGVHAQTRALYRLLDTLRSRHPGLQIESCASGGGRVDLGILERTDRVWASDCNDPLERQSIQRWTSLLLPPELIGAHVAAPRSHTTGRTHHLAFRAGTALFGSFGVEWDLTRASPDERAELARWIAIYKRHRRLLHDGVVLRVDHPDPTVWVHGVLARDGGEALVAVVVLATGPTVSPGPVRIPGLPPDRSYLVRSLGADEPPDEGHTRPVWWAEGAVVLSGRALAVAGLQLPVLEPERLMLLHLTDTERATDTERTADPGTAAERPTESGDVPG